MKEKDIKIIRELRKNARESLTTMSRRTGIPVSTIFDRIRIHQGTLITKNTCLLNFEELGYSTRAKATIKVGKESKQAVQAYLYTHPNVNSLYKINSGYDFMFELIFKNIKELEEFMENLDFDYDIEDRKVYYIIDDIKREEFMSSEIGV